MLYHEGIRTLNLYLLKISPGDANANQDWELLA